MVKSYIRDLRLKAKVDVNEASERLGISYSMLTKIETGYRRPGPKTIIKMAKLYGCSIDDIYKCLDYKEE